jgi:hypothetical protein
MRTRTQFCCCAGDSAREAAIDRHNSGGTGPCTSLVCRKRTAEFIHSVQLVLMSDVPHCPSAGDCPRLRQQPVLIFCSTSQQHEPCLHSMQPCSKFGSVEAAVLVISNAKLEPHLLGILSQQLRLQEAQRLLQIPRLHNQLKLREWTALIDTAECQVTHYV